MGDPTEWFPARLLQGRPECEDPANGDPVPPPFALIILNQPLRDVSTLKTLWKNGEYTRIRLVIVPVANHAFNQASLKVAADGGANRLLDARRDQQDLGDIFVRPFQRIYIHSPSMCN